MNDRPIQTQFDDICRLQAVQDVTEAASVCWYPFIPTQ